MKKIIFLISIIILVFAMNINAQKYITYIPDIDTANGELYWMGRSVKQIASDAQFIFEGRVLTDSVFAHPVVARDFTAHKVLVLKQFKGIFTSDTITVANNGGKKVGNWEDGERISFVHIGDEAIFFASNATNMTLLKNSPNLYFIVGDDKSGFIKVCDKKDIVSEVYEPIEKATGQGYVDVHPNTCANQPQK
jgi:hypothetical protein